MRERVRGNGGTAWMGLCCCAASCVCSIWRRTPGSQWCLLTLRTLWSVICLDFSENEPNPTQGVSIVNVADQREEERSLPLPLLLTMLEHPRRLVISAAVYSIILISPSTPVLLLITAPVVRRSSTSCSWQGYSILGVGSSKLFS